MRPAAGWRLSLSRDIVEDVVRLEHVQPIRGGAGQQAGDLAVPVRLLDVRLPGVHEQELRGEVRWRQRVFGQAQRHFLLQNQASGIS